MLNIEFEIFEDTLKKLDFYFSFIIWYLLMIRSYCQQVKLLQDQSEL